MNICAECRHCREGMFGIPVCYAPSVTVQNRITGYVHGKACSLRRGADGDCPDWTPRPAPWWRRIWRKEAKQ